MGVQSAELGDCGDSGDWGDCGLTGEAGLWALTGEAGLWALTGDFGLTGLWALTGDFGLTGEAGLWGETGLAGDCAETGDFGLTGDLADSGEAGLAWGACWVALAGLVALADGAAAEVAEALGELVALTGETGGCGLAVVDWVAVTAMPLPGTSASAPGMAAKVATGARTNAAAPPMMVHLVVFFMSIIQRDVNEVIRRVV
ncbi:hypothetical protein [Microlunatus sp. Y2014]|uniref:hypothetical protein n=1 Tax=Microlunatus sp. Y2014 TaxID=3418488 RepID=UPI003DA6E4DE